jgi:MFS family permease
MSCWYTRKELALRTSILYSGLLVAQCVSGLLAAGIFAGMDGAAGLAGWQWLFIVEALMSTVCGIAAFWTLPDYPHSTTGSQRWSMNDDMRRLSEARIVADRVTGSLGSGGVMAGLKMVLKDVKFYIFAWMNLVMTAGYGFNFFFPTLISGLNIGTNITALLLTSPPYLLGAILAMTIAWNSDRMRERGFHMLGALCAAIVGYIITLSTTSIPARYAATFFYCPGSFAANALVYSWAMSTLSTTPEKKAAGGAAVNVVGHIGNVVSPYFFLERERPTYRIAFIIMLVFIALSIATVFSTKVYLKVVNRKLKKQADETGETYNPFTT